MAQRTEGFGTITTHRAASSRFGNPRYLVSLTLSDGEVIIGKTAVDANFVYGMPLDGPVFAAWRYVRGGLSFTHVRKLTDTEQRPTSGRIYTIEAGRLIKRDGEPFMAFRTLQDAEFDPTAWDAFARAVPDLISVSARALDYVERFADVNEESAGGDCREVVALLRAVLGSIGAAS